MERRSGEETLESPGLKIRIIRHSSKGADGNLDFDGISNAKAYPLALEDRTSLEIFSSDVTRCRDTAKLIGESVGIPEPTVTPILSEYPFTEEQIEGMNLSGGKWLLVEPISSHLAGKVASFIIDRISSYNQRQNTQIVAVSHVPPIMAFAGHTLAVTEAKSSIDSEIMAKLFEIFGGFVKPLEGLDIFYSGSQISSVSVHLPNTIVNIPTGYLRMLRDRVKFTTV